MRAHTSLRHRTWSRDDNPSPSLCKGTGRHAGAFASRVGVRPAYLGPLRRCGEGLTNSRSAVVPNAQARLSRRAKDTFRFAPSTWEI